MNILCVISDPSTLNGRQYYLDRIDKVNISEAGVNVLIIP